jgi:LysR family transcriptional regulator, hydrogen peroxide-inducible genes activator
VNTRDLRYLVSVAERAHFGRAAQDCNVSQPTLSTQIRKLEEYLGATLIERNAKSISLTRAGHDVVRRARRILAEVEGLLSAARVAEGPLAGVFNLGIIPTLAPYFLPWFIPLTKLRYPRLKLVVQEDLTSRLVELLRAYQIDAALLALPLQLEDTVQLPLFDEPFLFACPPQHPLAKAGSVSDADLRDQRLLLLAEGHCLRGQALAACGRDDDGRKQVDDFSAVSLETLLQLVATGFGCTLLPALAAVRSHLPHMPFKVLPIDSAHASRRIGLVWREGYPKSDDLTRLAALVREAPPRGTRAVGGGDALERVRSVGQQTG